MRIAVFFGLFIGFLNSCTSPDEINKGEDRGAYVNTFTGTDGPGNTYPGAVFPFGMVQLSPDNGLPGWDRIAGYYWPDSTIAGFSHTHLSGTGAGDMYDLLLMPLNSRFKESLTPTGDYRPYSLFSHEKEQARPGYYAVELLSSEIKAELTVSQRVGMHRYTFPKDEESQIILDLGYSLNWDKPVDTKIVIEDEQTISGYRNSTGWANDQRVYFVIQFSKPFNQTQLFKNNQKVAEVAMQGVKTRFVANYKTKDNEEILVKVALSSVSIEGARSNMKAEMQGWNFDKIVQKAQFAWENYLGKIKIEGTQEQKELFYTNLYHCFLTPSLFSDVDGQYKGADGEISVAKGYDKYDTFSLWDTFRATHPLYTLLCPQETQDMIQSFLSHYDETGLLPVWSMVGNETNMMIGYHAVPVLVDAYFKGIPMDASKVLRACVASAIEDARQIDKYKKLGYVPADEQHEGWSVSKTLEYAYDDWCIAQLAQAIGEKEIFDTFSKRAHYWKNLYDPSSTFFRPKDADGNFVSPFKPKEYTRHFCESNAWQYFWFVPHDIKTLRQMLGEEKFKSKLDSMFTYYPEPGDKLPIFSTGMIGQYAHGNEPSHHVAYLYNEIGEPWKTQKLVREIISSQYSTNPDGYCGNEDCGQMSAWLVFSSMGMYPVNPANGVYQLTSPSIRKAVIPLDEDHSFTVIADKQSDGNHYIQEVYLDGQPYHQTQITHQQILQGGTLRFVLGDQPNKKWFQ